MPLSLFINDALPLRIHRIHGAITGDDFLELARYYGENRSVTHTDMIHLVDAAADFSAIGASDLPVLSEIFAKLQRGLDSALIRRSLWVCPNVRAWALLEEWLKDRHSHDGRSTDVYLVASLEEGDCLFDETELEAVRLWRGFRELARFPAPRLPQREDLQSD